MQNQREIEIYIVQCKTRKINLCVDSLPEENMKMVTLYL